jgi:Uncharacterised nucleotidyltransferase
MLAKSSDSPAANSASVPNRDLVPGGATENRPFRHDREFELLAACALWPRDPADRERVRAVARQHIDWEIFLEMVYLHRLEPIVYHNLMEYAREFVPAEVVGDMEGSSVAKGMSVFHNLAEIFRLIKLFGEAAIRVRILKGIPLAILVYGDMGLREAGDIDILIHEKDILAADEILQNSGYLRTEPTVELTPRRFAYYIRHWKDFVYRHRASGHSVELHWRLTRNRAMSGGSLSQAESLSYVAAGSGRIPTLAFDDLFLYLCVHGAFDGWMRLKSLADVASLGRSMHPADLERLANLAAEHGVLPEFTASLLLANRVFKVGISCPQLLPATHPVVRRILDFSWHAISANDYRLQREAISGLEWAWYEWGLRKSPRYRWQVLQRVLFRPRVWARFPLPDPLFYLYPLLSPLEWALYHFPFQRR